MTLPALAAVAQLEKRLGIEVGTLTGADLGRAEADLEDASNLVRSETGRDWVDDSGALVTVPGALVTVVLRAARRCYRNPDEYSSETEEGYTWRREDDAVAPYLTAQEVTICQRYGGSSPGLHVVRTTRVEPRSRHDVLLLSTSHGGDALAAYDPDDVGW